MSRYNRKLLESAIVSGKYNLYPSNRSIHELVKCNNDTCDFKDFSAMGVKKILEPGFKDYENKKRKSPLCCYNHGADFFANS